VLYLSDADLRTSQSLSPFIMSPRTAPASRPLSPAQLETLNAKFAARNTRGQRRMIDAGFSAMDDREPVGPPMPAAPVPQPRRGPPLNAAGKEGGKGVSASDKVSDSTTIEALLDAIRGYGRIGY
jgi:hypothetical protein